MTTSADEGGRVAIRDGLLTGDLGSLEQVHLCGSRCASCGETALGAAELCPNCGSDQVAPHPLGDRGTLYTYTVVRHRPPGNYRGPEVFQPFGLGLVQIDDVLRVLAPLSVPIDELDIGMDLRFRPYVLREDEKGREVVAFDYTGAGA